MQNLTRTIIISLLCATFFWTTNSSAASIWFTFDSDNEGFRELTYTNEGVFQSDDGPAQFDGAFGEAPSGPGSLFAEEKGPNVAARFGAPTSLTGDLSAFAGGTITVDLIIKANPGGSSLPVAPGIFLIEGGGTGLAYVGALPTFGSWTTYSATLGPNMIAPGDIGSWLIVDPVLGLTLNPADPADFAAVLPNVIRFSFNGEVTDATDDTIGADNIHLSPIPIPAALPLLGSALFGLGFVSRRRAG